MDRNQTTNYRMFQRFMRPVFDVMVDTSIQHPQRVPEDGPCVVVANHRSDQDPFLIITNIKRPINWLGASYLWNIPVVRDFLTGIGAIPVSKYRSEIRAAFDKAADLLREGQAVGIFPEGWDYIAANQFDWSVGQFQTGFARIALRTGSPVVPMALLGLVERRSTQPFPPFIRKILDYPFEMQYIRDRCVYQKLHINIGRPIPCPENIDPEDVDAVRAFTQQVNEAVIDLYNAIPKMPGFEDITPKTASQDVPPEPDPEPTAETDEKKPETTDEPATRKSHRKPKTHRPRNPAGRKEEEKPVVKKDKNKKEPPKLHHKKHMPKSPKK
jgi:1-acyl-sn-glycerol-3-phosphate acyltransferase